MLGGVYWGEIFPGGRGMSKFSAGRGGNSPHPPSRENPGNDTNGTVLTRNLTSLNVAPDPIDLIKFNISNGV